MGEIVLPMGSDKRPYRGKSSVWSKILIEHALDYRNAILETYNMVLCNKST